MDKLILGSISPLGTFRNDLFGRVQSEFDQFFHEFFSPDRSKRASARKYPKLNVYQKDKNLIIEAAVPGLKKDDISIFMEGNLLTIEAEAQAKRLNKDETFFTKELKTSAFSRTIRLCPEIISKCEPLVELKDGILKIVFTCTLDNNTPKRKQIDIL